MDKEIFILGQWIKVEPFILCSRQLGSYFWNGHLVNYGEDSSAAPFSGIINHFSGPIHSIFSRFVANIINIHPFLSK
jgi:hypothetical protein